MPAWLLYLIWVLNLGISIFNGIQTGKGWVESRHAGGGRRFMAWMGAIMTAVGFTWCIVVVLSLAAGAFHWLDAKHLEAYFAASYVLLIGPLLFSGYAITISSWARAYRQRGFANFGMAGYNTFANVYNTYQAVSTLPDAIGKMLDGFKSDDDDDAGGMVIILLLLVAFASGVLLTYWLINKYAAAGKPMPDQQHERYDW